jgi:glycosyltransferase involved in cell wall biosynthesis
MTKMKILVICKRQYTGKDLIDDQYGRLAEIPSELALLGNEVQGITLSYRVRTDANFDIGGVTWQSINTFPIFGAITQFRLLRKKIKEFEPDIIWASSDAWICIISSVAAKGHVPLVLDIYDNYDSFTLTKFPFMKWLFKKACFNASGLSAVTTTLIEYLRTTYELPNKHFLKIGNAINERNFFAVDQVEARKKMGLPQNRWLIGTAGAIHSNRGIDALFEATAILKGKDLNIDLVFAGPRDGTPQKYEELNFIDLGTFSHELSSYFYSALDVAVICNTDSAFGNYCFPQKFAEICACKTNFVAANLGELAETLKQCPQALFEHNSPQDLANKIEQLLFQKTKSPNLPTLTWHTHALSLESFFKTLLRKEKRH